MKLFDRLNIGCGNDFRESWSNLDLQPREEFRKGTDIWADLEKPPLMVHDVDDQHMMVPADSFSFMHMSHVIEHLHRPLLVMQELHRIAKPGCVLEVSCPYGSSDDAFEDPTHYRQYFLGSWYYFDQGAYHKAQYGYRGDWEMTRIRLRCRAAAIAGTNYPGAMKIIMRDRNVVIEQIATLVAVKPARDPGVHKLQYIRPEVEAA